MRVYIHPDLCLDGQELVDTYLHVRYQLTPDTAWLLRCVVRDPRAEQIITSAARHSDIAIHEARVALYKLLGYLNNYGGVRVMQARQWTVLALRTHFLWRKRHRATPGGLCAALFTAYGGIAVGLTALWYGACLAYHMPLIWIVMPSTVLFSCTLHELGHVIAVACSGKPAVMVSRIGYAAVMYVKPGRRQAQMIAAAGPAAAALPYILAALWLPAAFAMCSFAVAALHMSSLLPWFADGKTIWRNI